MAGEGCRGSFETYWGFASEESEVGSQLVQLGPDISPGHDFCRSPEVRPKCLLSTFQMFDYGPSPDREFNGSRVVDKYNQKYTIEASSISFR